MFNFNKIQQRLIFVLIAIIILLSGTLLYMEYFRQPQLPVQVNPGIPADNQPGMNEGGTEAETVSGEEKPVIKICMTGQVRNPGILEMAEGDRLADAIEAAGGVLPDADMERVNLALKVKDEGMYHIPAKGEEISDMGLAYETGPTDGRIDINSAGQSELEKLNGIGPAKAARIIQYREENGGFKTVEELMNVTGIGEKTFEGLKDQVCIR